MSRKQLEVRWTSGPANVQSMEGLPWISAAQPEAQRRRGRINLE